MFSCQQPVSDFRPTPLPVSVSLNVLPNVGVHICLSFSMFCSAITGQENVQFT